MAGRYRWPGVWFGRLCKGTDGQVFVVWQEGKDGQVFDLAGCVKVQIARCLWFGRKVQMARCLVWQVV